MIGFSLSDELTEIKDRISIFVRDKIIPYEKDPRNTNHGPSDELRLELNELARQAGLFAPQLPTKWGVDSIVGTAIALKPPVIPAWSSRLALQCPR